MINFYFNRFLTRLLEFIISLHSKYKVNTNKNMIVPKFTIFNFLK